MKPGIQSLKEQYVCVCGLSTINQIKASNSSEKFIVCCLAALLLLEMMKDAEKKQFQQEEVDSHEREREIRLPPLNITWHYVSHWINFIVLPWWLKISPSTIFYDQGQRYIISKFEILTFEQFIHPSNYLHQHLWLNSWASSLSMVYIIKIKWKLFFKATFRHALQNDKRKKPSICRR